MAHPSIRKYHFLWPADMRFGSRDYWLTQSHYTIAYTRVLQYWAEKAQPPIPGQPRCLAKSLMELQWAMEPLVSLMEVGVFVAMAPSNWMEVSMPQPMQPIAWDPCHSHSHSQSSWAHPKGVPVSSPRGKLTYCHCPRWMCPPLHPRRWCCHSLTTSPHVLHPGSQRLCKPCGGKNPWKVAQHWSLVFHLRKSVTHMMSAMMVTHLLWHPTMGKVFIDIVMCTEDCGPGAWPHGGWPPAPNPAQAFQLGWLDSLLHC